MFTSATTSASLPTRAIELHLDVGDPPGDPAAPRIDGRSAAEQIRPVVASIDGSIAALTDRIQGSTDVADGFGGQLAALRVVDEAMVAARHGLKDPVDLTKLTVTDDAGATVDARTYLQRAGVEFTPRAPTDGELAQAAITGRPAPAPQPTVTRADLAARIDSVTEQRSQATSQNQLGMLRLQELLHQRNLILQLTSNRLAAEEQTARALVGNIR